MIWKVFVSCAIANFWVSFLTTIYDLIKNGGSLHDSSNQTSVLKFGSAYVYQDVNALYTLPGSIILGVIGGATGALFINVNTRMAGVRKQLLKKKWMKPFETFLFAFVTASFFFWVPRLFNKCSKLEIETKEEKELTEKLRYSFLYCEKLQRHIKTLFSKGSTYLSYNSNLLFHGCVPLDEKGDLKDPLGIKKLI